MFWRLDRIGSSINVRAPAYSSWIAACAGTVDTGRRGFTLWEVTASRSIRAVTGDAEAVHLLIGVQQHHR